jgi:Helix-turn-helix.
MEKWHERLDRERMERGWSKAEFARRSGLPLDAVYKYLAGGVKRPPDDRTIAALAATVGWTSAQLMYGVVPAEATTMAIERPSSMRRVPVYNWGDLGMLSSTGTDVARALKKRGDMPIPFDDVSATAFYTQVQDDANSPEISKGSLILCDPERQPIVNFYVLAMIAGQDRPMLGKYTVERYVNGEPVELALIDNYGRHVVKASDVHILGLITFCGSRMAPPVT